jgi:hypothetical protein
MVMTVTKSRALGSLVVALLPVIAIGVFFALQNANEREQAAELKANLLELEIPPGWVFISEQAVDNCDFFDFVEACPLVRWTYEVEAGPAFAQEALEMLTGAGMSTDSTDNLCEDPDERGCHIQGNRGDFWISMVVTDDVVDGVLVVSMVARSSGA